MGHIFVNVSNCYQKYLSAQREVRLQMGSNIAEFLFHITFAYLTIAVLNLKLTGLAIVISLDYLLRP
jgi:hypothetical protein